MSEISVKTAQSGHTHGKICMLGDGGVGKTAFTIQFTQGTFIADYDPTVEDSYRKQTVIDEIATMVEILDTAGQEEFKSLRDQWIRSSQGFVVMYAIDSLASFNKVQTFVENIEIVYDRKPNLLNIVLIANKSDLEDEQEVSREAGEQYAKMINAIFKEASAKTKSNVEESIFEIVRKMRSNPLSLNVKKVIKPKGGVCNLL